MVDQFAGHSRRQLRFCPWSSTMTTTTRSPAQTRTGAQTNRTSGSHVLHQVSSPSCSSVPLLWPNLLFRSAENSVAPQFDGAAAAFPCVDIWLVGYHRPRFGDTSRTHTHRTHHPNPSGALIPQHLLLSHAGFSIISVRTRECFVS